ncbi:hypothetical protein [Fodinibius sp.]|nr:hypothetical protein [Fodinibius sp.]MDZ7660522.1 hypothetical protein [Fodinibius sp.]
MPVQKKKQAGQGPVCNPGEMTCTVKGKGGIEKVNTYGNENQYSGKQV